ncbi:hypothetical protein PG994_009578 [Apiospora phragmitis]|uniref:Uncharacterized protein n=1 Tax=Apiospora phragmitis TaxID=2905665 RepID=A0ABR1U6I7_9PEZI
MELLSHLVTPLLDEVDLQHVLCNTGDAILEHRDRAEQLMATRELHAWMTSPGSSPFGVMRDSVDGIRVSSVFFCGLHRRNNAYSGGVAMIWSLAQQLVEHFPAPTIELDSRLDTRRLDQGDLSELCSLFMCLMYRLPPRVAVFCLIDGIQQYERSEEHLPGMMAVVTTLISLVNECNTPTGGILKLLLVSPCEIVEVRREFDQLPGGLLHMARLPSF